MLLSFVAGCSSDTGGPSVEAPARDPESSAVTFQAVDAGTGSLLVDDMLTVRYLVRAPITIDEAGVEQVSSSEPYRIAHSVAEDSLVLEVRLEAASYHRLDTVLVVARGASVGPMTLRMARRLDRSTRAGRPVTEERPTSDRTETRPSPTTPSPAADPDAAVDRSAMRTGDEAFNRRDWFAATRAYERMEEPTRPSGTYAQEYAQALVRRGASHINLGEWAGALDALEEAVTFDAAGFSAYLLLAQTQCGVGRIPAGRQTLTEIGPLRSGLSARERPVVQALVEYQKGICSFKAFGRAEATRDLLRTGSRAVRELEGFIELGEALSPAPARVASALGDARRRVEEIRDRLRRGGRGGGQGPQSGG